LLGKRLNGNLDDVTDEKDLFAVINKNYNKIIPTCEELVQKWHSRAQVNSSMLNTKLNKKNIPLSSLQQPILTQVYKTLENKQFIETRSHQKREIYRVLGKPTESIEEKLDFQIYDDKDFYQGLFKDLLSSTSEGVDVQQVLAEGDNSMSLTQEYLKKREKMKQLQAKAKKTNKISKDRKLKYIIHDKLISFMVPQDEELLAKGREDILKILFGCSAAESSEKQADGKDSSKLKKENKRAKLQEDEDLGMQII